MHTVKLFLIALVLFLFTDMIWLGFIAKAWYLKEYAPWLRLENGQLQPIWWATGLVYFLFTLSVIVFILPLAKGSMFAGLLYGAAMGMIVYGIYDFTCLAILKDWPLKMAFVDWAWGTFLCGWVAMLTTALSHGVK